MKEGAAVSVTIIRVTFFTFTDISFGLPVSQSQVKQPHLLLPFLLLTALPGSPCGHTFPGSAVLNFMGQSRSKSLLEEPVGQLLHPVQPLCSSSSSRLCPAVVRLYPCSTRSSQRMFAPSQPPFSQHAFLITQLEGTGFLGGTVQQRWPERPFNDFCFSFSATSETPTPSAITGVENQPGSTSHMSRSMQYNLGICTLASSDPKSGLTGTCTFVGTPWYETVS